jgi:hypothetical protein
MSFLVLLNVIMLSVAMLNVIMLSVAMLNVILLSPAKLRVLFLIVVLSICDLSLNCPNLSSSKEY